MDLEKAPQWAATLLEVETLSGTVEQVGSVHTCLHGGGGKMVHFRVALDQHLRRGTDRLWNVPFVNELYQTWEVKPSAAGSQFTLYYALRPGVPIDDGIEKSTFSTPCDRAARATYRV